jgi:CubicO group peptidase (beta-lactamase class C family)
MVYYVETLLAQKARPEMKRLLTILLLGAGTLLAGGQAADQDVAAPMDAYLAACHKLDRFSGSVLVAHKGRIVLSKGYGCANYELGVPNSPETRFRLGSVTKQFTAMAILQLEERGKLKVTDTVKSVFPDYPGGEKITIHNLLTHTSGIPNFTDLPDYLKIQTLPSPVLQTVERFKNLPLDFAPGEKFSYSNSGYILLGAVIEKVTGGTYEEFVRENIFRPLGMEGSGYDHNETILKSRASGYEFPEDRMANASYIDMSIPHAAGALYSTVEDLYKWDRALYTDKLISPASRTRLFTPFKGTYAYGWSIGSFAGRKTIGHGGGINGFTTDIIRFPDDDACVIVLNNFATGFTAEISRALAGYLFGQDVEMPKEKKEITLPDAVLDAYRGQYKLEGTQAVFTVTREGNRLIIQLPGQAPRPLHAESETGFFLKSLGFEITFVKDTSGRVTHFLLLQGKHEMKALKVG